METEFRRRVVWYIVNGEAEKALQMLAEHYRVGTPKLKVGLPKGKRVNSLGCYYAKTKTISVLNSDILKEPFIILHEFYHHLRTKVDLEHKGTEKNANKFAREFIEVYKSTMR